MMKLTEKQFEVLRVLYHGGKISRIQTNDDFDYQLEDFEQNGSFLYKQTFDSLIKNNAIEKYLSFDGTDFYTLTDEGKDEVLKYSVVKKLNNVHTQ